MGSASPLFLMIGGPREATTACVSTLGWNSRQRGSLSSQGADEEPALPRALCSSERLTPQPGHWYPLRPACERSPCSGPSSPTTAGSEEEGIPSPALPSASPCFLRGSALKSRGLTASWEMPGWILTPTRRQRQVGMLTSKI